jgi:RES domain-containing protein
MSALPGIAQFLAEVRGTFYREVDRDRAGSALAGSHGPGRYSRANQPTLYLSASRAGVDAAMQAHRDGKRPRTVLAFEVAGANLLDLRVPEALALVRREAGDPLGDWQGAVAHGETPCSWRARDWAEAAGAAGLIDPSRQRPGLWHLVLFRWNEPGAPTVHPLGDAPS